MKVLLFQITHVSSRYIKNCKRNKFETSKINCSIEAKENENNHCFAASDTKLDTIILALVNSSLSFHILLREKLRFLNFSVFYGFDPHDPFNPSTVDAEH